MAKKSSNVGSSFTTGVGLCLVRLVGDIELDPLPAAIDGKHLDRIESDFPVVAALDLDQSDTLTVSQRRFRSEETRA